MAISPNTFHTLHCLVRRCLTVWSSSSQRWSLQNYIRKSLDRKYYTEIQDLPKRPFRISHRMHLGPFYLVLWSQLLLSKIRPLPRGTAPDGSMLTWHDARSEAMGPRCGYIPCWYWSVAYVPGFQRCEKLDEMEDAWSEAEWFQQCHFAVPGQACTVCQVGTLGV